MHADHTTITTRRTAGVLATTAVAGILTITPAFARQDPGHPPLQPQPGRGQDL